MRYPSVLGEVDTLRLALEGRSLARYGDGELKLALGRSAKSQAAAPDLAAALRRILAEHRGKGMGGPCLPCIPAIASPTPKAPFWRQYAGGQYTALYRQESVYGSSFVTRPDSAPWIDRPGYWAMVRRLWAGRDVVLVRGSTKSLTAGELEGAASVAEIVGPRQHAWASVAELRQALRGERRRILLCLGATATVLAWEIAQEGGQAVDVGHIGMFLRKVGAAGVIVGPALTAADKAA